MIYVIVSAALKEGSVSEYETILKIGYTNDNRGDGRFEDYKTTNPTCRVLYKIPEGSTMEERLLHLYFKEFKYPGTNEWFYYTGEIIEFFEIYSNYELLNRELNKWCSEDCDTIKRVSSISLFKKFIWPYLAEAKNNIEDGNHRIYYEFNSNYVINWLEHCGYPWKEADRIVSAYNNTKSKITPELSEFITKMQNSDIDISKRLQNLCESDFSIEDKKFISRQTSSWFNKFGNILGLDRCSELNYNITDIVREILIIENKNNITKRIFSEFEVGNIYQKEDIKKKLNKVFNRFGIYNHPFDISLIEKYYEIIEIDPSSLKLLKRTEAIKRRLSYLDNMYKSPEDGKMRDNEISRVIFSDIYKEFQVGKTYSAALSKLKILDISNRRHKLNMDTFVKPELFLRSYFKIKVYDISYSDNWEDFEDDIMNREIDILERLELPEGYQLE